MAVAQRYGANFSVTAGVLLACLVLGGGTHAGFAGDVALQLVAIPVLLSAAYRAVCEPSRAEARLPVAFCGACIALPLIQLVPLPVFVWTRLPSRELLLETMSLAGTAGDARALSLSPDATWLGLLSLLPPMAVFLSALRLQLHERRVLSLLLIAFAVASAMLGLLQVAQGRTSWLRPYTFTNENEAVGLFANRNHLAALLYCGVLLVAAWAVHVVRPLDDVRRIVLESAWIVPLAICLIALIVLVAGATMARSRAGLALTMLALAAGVAIAFRERLRGDQVLEPGRALAAATVFAVLFAIQFGLYRVLERFSGDPLEDARVRFVRTTLSGAIAFLPFGSGIGTFVPIYASLERPVDLLPDTYANRAHNDLLEFTLEGGVLAVLILLVFAGWLAARSFELWRNPWPRAAPLDHALARAAACVCTLLVLHSAVDYPLRTTALSSLFAFACALLVAPATWPPPTAAEPVAEAASRPKRTRARAAAASPAVADPDSAPISSWPTDARTSATSAPLQSDEAIDWPEEWRSRAHAGSDTPEKPGRDGTE